MLANASLLALTFRDPNNGIPGHPEPANEWRRSKLHLWRIATVQSGSKLPHSQTPMQATYAPFHFQSLPLSSDVH